MMLKRGKALARQESTRDVYIGRDLTRKERLANKDLREELKARRARGKDVKPNLIFITETWLHPDIKNAGVMLSGFGEPIRKDRKERRGGGCIMYAKHRLMLCEENIVNSEDTESVLAGDATESKQIKEKIGLCYVPPNDRVRCQTTPHLS